ncbi:MAG TPA: hypothetical protein VFM64_03845 [Candidatus Nitrosotenuis sp.]|nr:hypothetical protein [Candidatus Nitrosotenuis sp.]
MVTRNQKVLIALVVVAVFAVAYAPISTAFAQESPDSGSTTDHQDAKTFDGKDGKSCSGKHKGEAST